MVASILTRIGLRRKLVNEAPQQPNRRFGHRPSSAMDRPMNNEQLLMVTSVGEAQQSVENALGRARHALRNLSQLDHIMGQLPVSLAPVFEDHRKVVVANMGLEERLRESLRDLEAAQRALRDAESLRDRTEADLAATRASLEMAEERLAVAETDRQAALSLARQRETEAQAALAELAQRDADGRALGEDRDRLEADWRALGADAAQLRLTLAGELDRRAVAETEGEALRARVAELEAALDEARAEAAASRIALDTARVELHRQGAALEAARGEKERLALDLAANGEARDRERRALASQIESLRGRGETTEAMLADLRRQLSDKSEALAAAERVGRDLRQRMERLEAAAQDAAGRAQALNRANTDLESSRLALVTRLDDTAKLLRLKEVALRRAEEQFAERYAAVTHREAGLQERIERLEAERAQLAMDLGLERQERAVMEGRFEALREENGRLAEELLRQGAAIGADSPAPRADDFAARAGKVRHIMDRDGLRG
jgi:chromosome segregation ATPase